MDEVKIEIPADVPVVRYRVMLKPATALAVGVVVGVVAGVAVAAALTSVAKNYGEQTPTGADTVVIEEDETEPDSAIAGTNTSKED